MKTRIKKIVALMLVCIMIFSAMPLSTLAAERPVVSGRGETYNHYPQVMVKGFGASCVKIYYEDDPEQKSLFYPIDEERLKGNLNNIDDYILKSIKNKQPNILRTVIYSYVMDSIGMLALNPDGSNMEGVVTEPVGLKYRGGGKYDFYYDCRLSPADSCDALYESINQVFEETNAERIELVGSSFGANIVTAYMYEYKDTEQMKKIDTVLLRAPSVGGMNFLGELFSGNFNVSPIGLCDFIDDMAEAPVLTDFLYLAQEAGILKPLLDCFAEPVLKQAVYMGIADAARDLLATLPTIWVCIPDEYFIPAMKFLYGENYNDPNHKYAELIAKVTYYHNEIANNATEIYLDAEKNNENLNVAVIAKFGNAAIPLSDGINIMDDGLVSLPVSAFGATCTTYGAKFADDYKQQKYTEYNFMSPEWNIDASTCAFPFTTWFVKGMSHTENTADYNSFSNDIIYEDLDVFTYPDRPQYLKVSEEDTSKLVPLTAPEEKEETAYDKFFAVLRTIVLLPKMIFDKLFGRFFR
jgi:pimeloyl-ACP methyl ester carboxylesterase